MPEGSVAQVEDWDSDESAAIPGTVVQAAQQRQQQRDKRHHRHQHASQPHSSSSSAARAPRALAGDRGRTFPVAKSPLPPPITIPTQNVSHTQQDVRSPTRKLKPVIHPGIQRTDSAHSAQQRSHPAPAPAQVPSPAPAPAPAPSEKPRRQCSDANCRDANCSRASDQRYHPQTQQPPSPRPHYTTNAHQYQQIPAYQYAQMSQAQAQAQAAAMMPPPPVPVARPRAGSTSHSARPVSIHGYSSLSYVNTPSGPPPSQSAYYAYSQPYMQQPSAYIDTPPPPTQMASYTPMTPVIPPSPTSTSITYPGYPGYSASYSARQGNPAVPGLEMPKQMPQPGLGLTRTISARQRPEERTRRQIQAPLPDPESTESESDFGSESDSDASTGEEYDRRRQDPRRRSYRKEDAVALVHHPRRPSMNKKYHTETTLPTRPRRESMHRDALRRAPRSDTMFDYQSSSDVGDSDRTARAVVERRSTYSSARSSRRPSVSTTASSGRTKATTISSMTDNSRGQLIVEGKDGRRTTYLSREDQAKLAHRYQQQQLEEKVNAQRLREETVAAYQKNTGGGDPFYELTAENVKKANNRKSGSHVSGRSQRSGGSGSKAARSEGIQIKSGDTVLHVYGDAKIEMRPSEDGGPASFVIASSNGREPEYRTSSKSSGSRVGRSRVRSDMSRRVIREDPNDYEDGYEVGR